MNHSFCSAVRTHRARTVLALLGSLSLALVAGCTVRAEPVVVVSDGSLVVDWTIAGRRDPSQCAVGDALRVTLYARGGRDVGSFLQDCTAFAMSVSLAPGDYTGTAVLVDGGDRPVTTQIDLGLFYIDPNTSLDIPIDFPPSSFL